MSECMYCKAEMNPGGAASWSHSCKPGRMAFGLEWTEVPAPGEAGGPAPEQEGPRVEPSHGGSAEWYAVRYHSESEHGIAMSKSLCASDPTYQRGELRSMLPAHLHSHLPRLYRELGIAEEPDTTVANVEFHTAKDRYRVILSCGDYLWCGKEEVGNYLPGARSVCARCAAAGSPDPSIISTELMVGVPAEATRERALKAGAHNPALKTFFLGEGPQTPPVECVHPACTPEEQEHRTAAIKEKLFAKRSSKPSIGWAPYGDDGEG